MAFPTSGLTNNQVHKEGNRAFVYDSTLGVWDQVRETDRTENLSRRAGEVVGSIISSYPPKHLLKVQCFDALKSGNYGVNVYSTSNAFTGNAVGACTFSPDGGGNNLSYIFAILVSNIEVQSTITEGRIVLETSASGADITNIEYSVSDWGGLQGYSGRAYGASHISKTVQLDGTGNADIDWQFSIRNESNSSSSAFTHYGDRSRIIIYEYKG